MKQRSNTFSPYRSPVFAASAAIAVLALAVAWAFPAQASSNMPAPVATPITGDIAADTTWTLAGSPYVVSGPVRVLDTATLTIEPGVVVQFAPTAGLRVEGQLNALGTQARQVRMVPSNRLSWLGLSVIPQADGATLQSVTIEKAVVGLALLPSPTTLPNGQSARVRVLDSLLTANTTAISVDYTGQGAGRITLRNNLLLRNGVGLLVSGNPGGGRFKLNHNSFVENGVGLRGLSLTGNALKAQQQWWGSADGPLLGAEGCAALPVPRLSPRDLACGNVDAQPWSKVQAGRAIVPPGASAVIESAVGEQALSDDDTITSTSLVTLTVPAGAFSQQADLLVAPRETPPTAPPGQPTDINLEVTAVSAGQEIHTFGQGKTLRLEFAYTDQDLNGADPADLTLYFFDEATGRWSFQGYTSQPDPARHRLVVYLSHLTRMRVMSTELEEIFVPMVSK
jgi:hypothetical protein